MKTWLIGSPRSYLRIKSIDVNVSKLTDIEGGNKVELLFKKRYNIQTIKFEVEYCADWGNLVNLKRTKKYLQQAALLNILTPV